MKKNNNKIILSLVFQTIYFLLFGATILLMGCNKDDVTKDLHQYIFEEKKKAAEPIKPLPDFISTLKGQHAISKPLPKNNFNNNDHFLSSYSVLSLNLVGVLVDSKQTWALVATPDGVISKIQVGDEVGEEKAKVIRITNTAVELEKNTGGQRNKNQQERIVLSLENGEQHRIED